jgi:SAM-dependent methyltransferase
VSADLEKALTLQAELTERSRALAALIAVPALDRDHAAIRTGWEQIARERAPLNALYRKLRKAAREQTSDKQRRDLQDVVKALNRVLQLWDEMEHLVAHHMDPPETPFNLDHVPQPHDALLDHLYMALHTLANPNEQDEGAVDHNCFADIPISIQRFELLLSAAYRLLLVQGRADGARFLDVGCGGATKVLAAARVFPHCDGLEYDPGYAEAGARVMHLTAPEAGRVMLGDALSFEEYGAYDVIYFYRPIADDDLLGAMHQRIADQARPGTVILAPFSKFLEPRGDFPAAQIKGPVYVTGVTQDEADAWYANAMRTGTQPIRRARHLRFDPGFWTPLLEAASFNGTRRPDKRLLPEEPRYDGFKAAVT